MKLWWLLVSKYSYLPLPQRWQAAPAELPRALVWLPLWGLAAGLLNAAAARWVWTLNSRWLAALLVFLTVFGNGALWLRDILSVCSGLKPPPLPPDLLSAAGLPAPPPPKPLPLNRGALLSGCLYLLLQYGCFLALLSLQAHFSVYVLAAVGSRFIYLWGVYDFAALQPAFLHRTFPRRDFRRAALISLMTAAACAWAAPALLPALVAALLAAVLFYRRRVNALGALDEAAYGAAAGWSEILFYLGAVLFFAWG